MASRKITHGLHGSTSDHMDFAKINLDYVEAIIALGGKPSPRQVRECIFILGKIAAHLDEVYAGAAKTPLSTRYEHARKRVLRLADQIGCGSR